MKRVKLIILILSPLLVWGTARFCHHQTKGFRLSKFQGNTTCLPSQKNASLSFEIEEILQQKFYYFGRGLQSFALLSEDGKTVLKIFNNRYQRRLFWLGLVPSIGRLSSWKENRIDYNRGKWKRTYLSYQIAYDKLRAETGLLYFHPQASEKPMQVALVDKIGITHKVDLSRMGFVLQKKAMMAYDYLSLCDSTQEWDNAKEALNTLVTLFAHKMDLGIGDNDPLIRTNIGFLDGHPMQIDIGPFSYDPSLSKKNRQKEEVIRITRSLKHWLENNHPKLLPYLDEALETL
ncbi:MAG: hypothetical protein KR126chlam1_00374 [Chlamydiae bacterium]|nr:hypothetical protein [Chlamydiota bacterium]